jgi:hypothetical protein
VTVHHNTRNNDYATSIEGAEQVTERAPNQRRRLLAAYYYADEMGLTDEEAANHCGLLDACYWKRCGELRTDGYIEFTDAVRPGAAGTNRKVSVITVRGRYAHQAGEKI